MAYKLKTGGGSRKGIPNKATFGTARFVGKSGLTPMAYLLDLMRDESNERTVRIEAAKAVAPYVHPRLASLEHSTDPNKPMMVKVSGTDGGL